jgi:hypothetical protein
MNEHLDRAKTSINQARGFDMKSPTDAQRMNHATIAIAEALTGILELLTGVIGDRGSVLDVRVQGSVSTGDQR